MNRPWINAVNKAQNAFTLRVLFYELFDQLKDADIHNAFFERIRHLENLTTDENELTSLSWLKYDLEEKVSSYFEDAPEIKPLFFKILKFLKPFNGVMDGEVKQ
jgi:hypothetical protein